MVFAKFGITCSDSLGCIVAGVDVLDAAAHREHPIRADSSGKLIPTVQGRDHATSVRTLILW
jgi:hypothetical protein